MWHIVHLAKSWSFDASLGTFSPSTFTTPATLKLFGFNWSGGAGVQNQASMRCRQFAVYDNNTLVRDFIPVRFTNESGQSEGAMYDRVSGQLLRNSGTGVFGFGTDIAGGGYKWLGCSPLRFSRFSRLWKEAA